MKRFNYYLSLMLLLVFTAACSDEFDQPPMVIPTAEHTPNMTIAEFKAKYWQDAVNYIDTVKEDIVIHGWVTSSDESGNIYKSLYISDGTAGINISINQNSLYNKYRLGQEVVIPMKGYFVGKYNGQQQLGYPAWYAYGRTQSLVMPRYKLFFPKIANKSLQCVLVDDAQLLLYNGMAFVSDDLQRLKVLKCFMESDVFWTYVSSNAKPYASGFYSLNGVNIKKFGIPNLSDDQIAELLAIEDKAERETFVREMYEGRMV